MFSKQLSRRDVPEGSVPSDVVIVQQPALNNSNHAGEIGLVPEPGTVLGLEVAVERFHLRVVPGAVERVGDPDLVQEPDMPQPLVGGVDGVLVVMHDHGRQVDAEVLQVPARPLLLVLVRLLNPNRDY